MKILRRLGGVLAVGMHAICGLYYLVTSPPLDLFYDVHPPAAGNSTIYVPGGGFSGFWYHLGYFEGMQKSLTNHDYYCYSSGCLSLILAYLHVTVDTAYDTCHDIQKSWQRGVISNFDLVPQFMERFVPLDAEQTLEAFYPHLHIIITTASNGAVVQTPKNRDELINLMVKTTWIPFATGNGVMKEITKPQKQKPSFSTPAFLTKSGTQLEQFYNHHRPSATFNAHPWHTKFSTEHNFRNFAIQPRKSLQDAVSASSMLLFQEDDDSSTLSSVQTETVEYYLDGGFSRRLHPACHTVASIPMTWTTLVHTLNPGVSRSIVYQMYKMALSASPKKGHTVAARKS